MAGEKDCTAAKQFIKSLSRQLPSSTCPPIKAAHGCSAWAVTALGVPAKLDALEQQWSLSEAAAVYKTIKQTTAAPLEKQLEKLHALLKKQYQERGTPKLKAYLTKLDDSILVLED